MSQTFFLVLCWHFYKAVLLRSNYWEMLLPELRRKSNHMPKTLVWILFKSICKRKKENGMGWGERKKERGELDYFYCHQLWFQFFSRVFLGFFTCFFTPPSILLQKIIKISFQTIIFYWINEITKSIPKERGFLCSNFFFHF